MSLPRATNEVGKIKKNAGVRNGRLPLTLVALFLLADAARGAEWANGMIVNPGSESPDGHYGIVIPNRETGGDENVEGVNNNYLADIPAHKLLGEIDGADYFEGQNHRGLTVTWERGGKWCVAKYEERFGFGSLYVLELAGARFAQMEIGAPVQEALDSVIAKESHKNETNCDATVWLRTMPGRKLKVRVVGSTNPKRFEERKTYFAYFEGTYDIGAKKWVVSHARPMGKEADDLDGNVFVDYKDDDFLVIKDRKTEEHPDGYAGTVVASEQEKIEAIEKLLNEVYDAVRVVLSHDQFAKVRQEQSAWLNEREKAGSAEAKCRLTESRIKKLQELAWER